MQEHTQQDTQDALIQGKNNFQQHSQHNATNHRPNIVILGGGFGGLQAAQHLSKTPANVTVIDRSNHHLFQPLLYQVATATLSPGEISAPIRHVLRRQQHTDVFMAEVTGVDTEQQRVLIQDQSQHRHEIPYDYLIVATGAHENYFGHDEWRAFAPGLKTIEDARVIRQKMLLAFEQAELEQDPERIQALLTFVIIGGGPTGVELAGDLAEVAHRVLKNEFRHINPAMTRIILVEAMPHILGTFPPKLAEKAYQKLKKLGVEVLTNTPATHIDENGITLGESYITAANIFWTAGVKATPVAKWLDAKADRAGRVEVQSDLSVPGHPNIFVIGDAAHAINNGKQLPGVAPVAMQQGRYVARLITRRIEQPQEQQPFPPFHYYDKGSLATVGRGFSIIQLGPLKLYGMLAWLLWLSVHILYLITFENRLLVMLQWAWSYITITRRVRLITLSSTAAQRREAQTTTPVASSH